jgi:hypothetical protein
VNTFTTGLQFAADVASDGSGNFVVVWSSIDASSRGVSGQRYSSSGAPLGGEFRVNTYTTNRQHYPSVASDTSGNFVVVWISDTQDGSFSGILGQRFASSGAPVGPEFRVNSYTTYYQGFPSVAADAAGSFVVVWQSATQDGQHYGIFGQRYAGAGVPAGPEFRVNTYTTSRQYQPSVAADASGNFVVVWSGVQGAVDDIFGQRYLGSGAPLGGEFRVNTYLTSQQYRPAVAADSSGDFVVVWSSYTQDGLSGGIFGQRYGQIVPVELMRFGVD